MRMKLVISAVLLSGCAAKPAASDVCKQIEGAGVAKPGTCKAETPAVMAARAKEKIAFDLAAVPGKTGQVLSFAKAEDYTATVKAFEAAAMLAGPHRYGSEKALIFVQLNDGASVDVGNKVKGLVAGL